MARARRMEEQGPDYFEWIVPHDHYPEVLSSEAHAWCPIAKHNRIGGMVEAELRRRAELPQGERARLDAAPALARELFPAREGFEAALRAAGTPSLRAMLGELGEDARRAPEVYAANQRRREEFARLTAERFKMLESGERPGNRGPPPPAPPQGGRK